MSLKQKNHTTNSASNKKLKSPVTWFGGKYYMRKAITQLFPEHKTYVEVFGGSAQVLFYKNPSPIEVYNDIDKGVVNFFRVIRDPDKFQEFYRKITCVPYSREEFYHCKEHWDQHENDVDRAVEWFVLARQNFSGELKNASWGFSVTRAFNNVSESVSKYLSSIDILPEIHKRLIAVQIECLDFRKIIPNYDTEDTLFYCDPPYMKSVRKGGKYLYEMSDEDHKELLEMLVSIKGKFVLSSYENELYDTYWMKNDWEKFEKEVPCQAVGRTKVSGLQGKGSLRGKQQYRKEIIYTNFTP